MNDEQMMRRFFLMRECDSSVCDKLFARKLFSEIRFTEGLRCEDIATTYRAVSQANRAVLCPYPLYYYYHRAGSITTGAFSGNILDYTKITGEVLKDIDEHYPQLHQEALYQRVVSVLSVLIHLELQPKSVIEQYREQYDRLKSEMTANKRFWSISTFFSRKEKLKCQLMTRNLYPAFHSCQMAALSVQKFFRMIGTRN